MSDQEQVQEETADEPTTDVPVFLSREEASAIYQTFEQVPVSGPQAKMLAASVQAKLVPILTTE